jgi:fatty-acyl-CoA synthase
MNTETTGGQDAGWRGKFAGFALAVSVFAVLWFAAAALGTRFGLWSWQFGLGQMTIGWGPMIVYAAAGLSVVALVLALIKAPRKQAVMLALAALLVSGLVLGRLAAFGGQASRLPPIHDVQTDWADPVTPTAALLIARQETGAMNEILDDPVIPEAADARWPGMGGRRVAEVQKEAEYDSTRHSRPRDAPYPQLDTLTPKVSFETAWREVEEEIRDRGWDIVMAIEEDGRIDATQTSLWFGFRDDIMIRIREAEGGVRIDVRSTSRVGLSDLGANAKRVRSLLDALETRLASPAQD